MFAIHITTHRGLFDKIRIKYPKFVSCYLTFSDKKSGVESLSHDSIDISEYAILGFIDT